MSCFKAPLISSLNQKPFMRSGIGKVTALRIRSLLGSVALPLPQTQAKTIMGMGTIRTRKKTKTRERPMVMWRQVPARPCFGRKKTA